MRGEPAMRANVRDEVLLMLVEPRRVGIERSKHGSEPLSSRVAANLIVVIPANAAIHNHSRLRLDKAD
jgi:hypothetical protein